MNIGLKSIVMFVCLAAVQSLGFAQGEYTGQISEVWVVDGEAQNLGWIKLPGSMMNPSCNSPIWFILDLDKPELKSALALALTAHALDKEVYLKGKGTCNGSYEWIESIAVK